MAFFQPAIKYSFYSWSYITYCGLHKAHATTAKPINNNLILRRKTKDKLSPENTNTALKTKRIVNSSYTSNAVTKDDLKLKRSSQIITRLKIKLRIQRKTDKLRIEKSNH